MDKTHDGQPNVERNGVSPILLTAKRRFSKSEGKIRKELKMRKVFPIFAVLMVIMLATVWLVGCGEDDGECDIIVEVDKTTPGPDGEMPANAEVSVTFKGGSPDVDSVKINGTVAECRGTTCSAGDLGLTEGETADIEIKWTYCDGKKSGEHSITVIVSYG